MNSNLYLWLREGLQWHYQRFRVRLHNLTRSSAKTTEVYVTEDGGYDAAKYWEFIAAFYSNDREPDPAPLEVLSRASIHKVVEQILRA
jgi:hypothetical protein